MNNNKVIIFGLLDTAELAYWYLKNDSKYSVEAFTVNQKYQTVDEFKGLPVVAFEELENYFPPDEFKLFAPLTGRKMNQCREKVYLEGKSKGYKYATYISSKSTICDNDIGENCLILENNTIQPFTKIGNNVVLWSGNHIGHHGVIKDHVFFTSHVVMSGHCVIESYCTFGVNSTIRDYTHVARGTLLGMGACLIDKNTDSWGVYVGNPAKKLQKKISYELF